MPAQRLQAVGGIFGAFDLDVHGLRAGIDGGFQDADLLFDAAVEFAVVLVAPAGGQDGSNPDAR